MRDIQELNDGDDRAVSDLVGFIMVFSLVVASIGFVYMSGFAGLSDTRDVEQTNNAERAFDVLAYNFEKLARGEAPNRATEIKLSDSQLRTGDRRIAAVEDASGDDVANISQHRPIVHEVDSDSRVVYEHGAVIRVDGENSTMQREPDFVFGSDRTVIRFIESGLYGGESVGGDTTVLVRASRLSSDLLYVNESSSEVTLQLNTTASRTDAWTEYLEAELPGNVDCDEPGTGPGEVAVVCSFETDSIRISRTRVRTEFS